ncbi:MAG: hypothetical protein IPN33_04455 [Saprospiraceae bacterium]|nr:hypothetical protein [Saprospiraceae bacterium]
MIDDTLALDYKKVSISDSDPSEWIDNFFRQSLAFIQARNNADYNAEPLLRYLKERNKLIMEQAGEFQNWKNFINTGMPFRASLKLKNLMPSFINIFEKFSITEKKYRGLYYSVI